MFLIKTIFGLLRIFCLEDDYRLSSDLPLQMTPLGNPRRHKAIIKASQTNCRDIVACIDAFLKKKITQKSPH